MCGNSRVLVGHGFSHDISLDGSVRLQPLKYRSCSSHAGSFGGVYKNVLRITLVVMSGSPEEFHRDDELACLGRLLDLKTEGFVGGRSFSSDKRGGFIQGL
jgi:hypothetical protein